MAQGLVLLKGACECAQSLQSCLTLFDPMDCSCQASLSMEFSRQEYFSGLPCPLPGIFPTQVLNPCLLDLLHCTQILYPPSHLGSPISRSFQYCREDTEGDR